MDDAHDAEPEQSPYVRLPWPLVAAGLVAILLVALGVGLFANRNLRQAEVIPTPIALAAPVTTPTPAPAPAVAPTPTSAPEPTPRASATAVAATATVPPPTLAATQTSPGTGLATPSARPTLDALRADEVGKAYENYWQVRTQALLELVKTHLEEVMASDHLDSMTHLIDELSSENRAIKTAVDHDFKVVEVSQDAAQVTDDYISDSVYVDPSTQRPLTEPASDELRVLYRLSRLGGKWKVVDSVRAD